MFRRTFHIVLGWYTIWFLVGLAVSVIKYESPVGNWEDLLFMMLASAVIFLDATRRVGWGIAGAIFLWIASVSGAVEMLGAMTGFPFGPYEYSGNFGPRIMGILPWAIPLAWWVVLYPLMMLVMSLARDRLLNPVFVTVIVALAATAVDLALEPTATIIRGYWIWDVGGAYYGVPLTNFFGWFITALIIVGPIQYYAARPLMESYRQPGAIFLSLAVLGSVLLSFLLPSLVNGMWLASLWTVILLLILATAIVRFAWPRRDVFMLERHGRYR